MTGDNLDKTKSNARFLESEIFNLENEHWSFGERLYKDFWNHVKEINILFKETKPLLHDDRERLWAKFSNICNEVRISQNREMLEKKTKSDFFYEDIMELVNNSRVNTSFLFDLPNIEEMKRLGSLLKEAGTKLSQNKNKMITEHKQICFNSINEIRNQHDEWWQELNRNRQNKKEGFINNVRENLSKNNERLRKATNSLEKLKDHRNKLLNDIDSAWNDNFKDRAYEWLSETEDKISDIELYIEKIEEWISEDEEKLNQI